MGRRLDLIAVALKLGPRRLVPYIAHQLKLRSGHYERLLPEGAWGAVPAEWLAEARSPFASPDREALRAAMTDPAAALVEADRIVAGELRSFGRHWLPAPATFHEHPKTGYVSPRRHFARYGHADPAQGDIKWLWEASRFDWVYQLGRAYALTGDRRYADRFATLVDQWREHNPPHTGINWNCGQECSLRLMALVWGIGVFGDHGPLWETVAALANRVAASIGYAVAQKNNHALAEATALFMAGHCLPNHPSANRWRRVGKATLLREIPEQFYPDGSYLLHSFYYHRVALRDLLAALTVARAFDDPFPPEALDRIRAGVRFLAAVADPVTGQAPVYGASDGSFFMTLSGADYLDMRPVLQALSTTLDGRRLFGPGPHDEEPLWWLGKPSSAFPLASPPDEPLTAPDGGYYQLRSGRWRGLLRCHTYRDRPTHADALHVDLWRGSENIFADGGSYQYQQDDGWYEWLRSTAAHNTVTVDAASQMVPGGRFLWLKWSRGRLVERRGTKLVGESFAYPDVLHRRTVIVHEGVWAVIDDLLPNDAALHRLSLYWRLGAGGPWEERDGGYRSPSLDLDIRLYGPAAMRVAFTQGESGYPVSGRSRYYGEVEPCAALTAAAEGAGPVRFVTLVGERLPDTDDNTITLGSERIVLAPAKG